MTVRRITLDYEPQPRQALLHQTPAHQVFYGGSAGGGKSHGLRWDAIGFALAYPNFDAFLFRRTLGELEDNHIRTIIREIPSELGSWRDQKKRFEFFNGSGINMCYCEREDDVLRYQGAEMHWLGVDEASHLSEFQLNYLRGRVRLGKWSPEGWQGDPSAKFKLQLPRIVFASNPGGPGHSFLKRTFIDPAPPETIFADESLRDEGNPKDEPWLTIYIPAKIRDNKYLPSGYAGQFKGLPPEMQRALADGDWDAVVGQALHNLSREKHMLRPFIVPRHWTRFMSIDWGTARPFSVGWYAVSDGAEIEGREGWPDRWVPAGAVVMYDEWYGWNGRSNEGLRLAPQEVAKGIIKREADRGKEWYGTPEVMDYRVGDSEMWANRGGPSAAEWFVTTDPRLGMKKSIKDRKRNYTEFLARLAGNEKYMETGEMEIDPMFFVTANCLHFWRTVPTLVLDHLDPEKGPETVKQEDHVYDNVAYGLRSRPFISTEEGRWRVKNRKFITKSGDPYATA